MTIPPDRADALERALGDRLRAEALTWGPPDLSGLASRADEESVLDLAWCSVDSPVGRLTLAATEAGLCTVSFAPPELALADLARRISPRILELPRRLDEPCRQLAEYFDGQRTVFDIDIDRRLSRGFRSEVLRALEGVEWGRTVSYRDLAATVGRPTATRAVGSAMATNPLPIVVPCHRVLRTGGALGGYAGGLDAKRWLLAHEGAPVPPR